jgi:hypothetical protein
MAIAVDIDQEAMNPAIAPYNAPAYDTLLNLDFRNDIEFIRISSILLFCDIQCHKNI